MDIEELTALNELSTRLSTDNVKQTQLAIAMPEGMCEDTKHGIHFINAIRGWKAHNPYLFYLALEDIRPDLIAVACSIPWLRVSDPSECEAQEKELSIKTLVELLKSELTTTQWLMIYIAVTNESGKNVGFEVTLTKMLEKGLINKDLVKLQAVLQGIQRNDIVNKLMQYQGAFVRMEDGEFEAKFKNELNTQAKELEQWQKNLKYFLQIQYGTVKQMLGDEDSVDLAEVYIELTILKQRPRAINLEDETTYNEIAYLRKIANKEVEITPVDFTKELQTYKPKKPEIWCLIGNPGCGKTFLAKRTALRFSSNELVGIQYTISVPCRNTDWHSMESTRYEEERKVESEFIQQWLCLGLPVGSYWPNDLAKHLNQTDGQGLLLIIDGLDEFTRKVPFGKTFLGLLLTRQSMTRSTIILTSRPGAWTDVSTNHELKIDRYYQVLGFSPENRDLYFKKQIANVAKLKACWDLMERHDEMKQLSLIPVNASLFAALLKGEDSASINTLTRLYSELTLYLIRREVARMGLHEFSRVAALSDLHPDIQACLKRIGFIAFLGVANRDLVSEENVPLIMGQEEYPSHCLGLAHEHYKKEAVGLIKKVWTFAHLTMQEFTAAHWLSNHSWTKQCFSIRYISHSTANFSLFRMLVRFLCGILSDRAAAVLSVMYRYLTPQPMQMIGMPLILQIERVVTFQIGPWESFTEFYLQINAILYETNSDRITTWFAHYRQFLPDPIYIYIRQTVSPNEWICFLQSLQLLSQIQLIHIDTKFINPKQFIDLIDKVNICSISYLALEFSGDYPRLPSTEILAYTDTIKDIQLMADTKLCLHLKICDVSNPTAVNLFSPNTIQILSGLILDSNTYSNEFLQLIAKLTALEYISIDYLVSDIIFLTLCQATQLKVLHLSGTLRKPSQLLTALPNFSNLQEIELPDYSLLPALTNLSNLTYLKIQGSSSSKQREDSEECASLLQLIFENRNTLRYLYLDYLRKILTDMGIFLNCLALCTNLVALQLDGNDLTTEDITLWSYTVCNMKVLVVLRLEDVRLYDTGFESLCAGLAYHPTIRELVVSNAKLTSLSYDPLIHLIPTVTQLEKLRVYDINKPDKEAYKLLHQTADEYSINHM